MTRRREPPDMRGVHQLMHMARRQTNAGTRFAQIVGRMDGPVGPGSAFGEVRRANALPRSSRSSNPRKLRPTSLLGKRPRGVLRGELHYAAQIILVELVLCDQYQMSEPLLRKDTDLGA
jgi:hypothetical protein